MIPILTGVSKSTKVSESQENCFAILHIWAFQSPLKCWIPSPHKYLPLSHYHPLTSVCDICWCGYSSLQICCHWELLERELPNPSYTENWPLACPSQSDLKMGLMDRWILLLMLFALLPVAIRFWVLRNRGLLQLLVHAVTKIVSLY